MHSYFAGNEVGIYFFFDPHYLLKLLNPKYYDILFYTFAARQTELCLLELCYLLYLKGLLYIHLINPEKQYKEADLVFL